MSVYRRNLPELKEVGEEILREGLGEEIELRWMTKSHKRERGVKASEFDEGRVEEYSDGSKLEGVAASVTRTHGVCLGELGTVMDAEMLGIALAWENGKRVVVLDSQGAIQRTLTPVLSPIFYEAV